jgi:hypothetical protein
MSGSAAGGGRDTHPAGGGRDTHAGGGGPRSGRFTRTLSMKAFVTLAVAVAVGLAFAASPFASSSPDGLERVAGDHGFADSGRLHSVQQDAPVPDYAFPGIDDPRLATGVAGFAGTLAVFALAFGAGVVLRRRDGDTGPAPAPPPAA